MFYAHNHTDVSNFKGKDSINKVEDLIDYSIEIGAKGLAITDHDTISNHIRALKYYKKLTKNKKINADEFKLALGNEIYLIDRNDSMKLKENNEKIDYFHLILIAKDKLGHDAIRQLSSSAWENSYYYRGMQRVPTYKDVLEKIMHRYKGHVICATACLGGELAKLSLECLNNKSISNYKKIFNFIKFMQKIFNDDFYIELQPSSQEDQIKFNKFAYKLAEYFNIKTIVTTDSHYLKKDDKIFHKKYLQSQNAEREVDSFYETTYLMKKNEIKEYINYLPINEIIKNTMDIYNKITFYDFYKEQQIPEAHIPEKFEIKNLFENYCKKYEYIDKYTKSNHKMDLYFLYLIEEGFLNKKQEFNDVNIARIDEELKEFWLISQAIKQRIASYYVLTKELIDIMWKSSLVGISRGSSSGSYCCYLLDIVQLNPIEHKIPFWRHIHHSRPDFPDVDVDSQSSKREQVFNDVKVEYETNGEVCVVNCCTFTTEKARAAILTAARGLELDHDIAKNIADMVTNPNASLHDCFYGNEEKKIKPIPGLKKELMKYEGLFEAVQKFEGLISGRSIHASGVFIVKEGINSIGAYMKTSTGRIVTQYNYEDSVYCGCMKFDFLSINALDDIRTSVDMLLKQNKIQWQGSLRKTYMKYLHPDVLEWDNLEMFKLLHDGEILDAFQYETTQGLKAIQKIKPTTYSQLVDGNSLMRLTCDGEQPIDKYVKNKKNINFWYEGLKSYELNNDEIKILEEILLSNYGIAITQEDAMILSMNPKIGNFTIAEANGLRKAIAKKNNEQLIKDTKGNFFKKGIENGNRPNILEYVWAECITPMLGYSFSIAHVKPYTAILMQEMNIAFKYGSIWWKTACLRVNSGIIDDVIEKNVDYGTIAKAMGKLKGLITAPDINKSDIGFTPFEKKNEILFGIASINGIGKNEIEIIMANRPYNSIDDFIEKTNLTPKKIITLIKAGCFDNLYCNLVDCRKNLLINYIKKITKLKSNLTLTNLKTAWELMDKPQEYEQSVNFCNIKKTIKKYLKNNKYYLDASYEQFLYKNKIEFEYSNDNNIQLIVDVKKMDKKIKNEIEKARPLLNDPLTLEKFNINLLRQSWLENCKGNKESWEMETTLFYHKKHELDSYNFNLYKIVNFNELSKEETNIAWKSKIVTIAGTVIDKKKEKNRFTILTQYGPVTIKLSSQQFLKYNKKVVEMNNKNKKIVLDESWLERGTKLLIFGYRWGDDFRVKALQKRTPAILKIIGQDKDGKPFLVGNKL